MQSSHGEVGIAEENAGFDILGIVAESQLRQRDGLRVFADDRVVVDHDGRYLRLGKVALKLAECLPCLVNLV